MVPTVICCPRLLMPTALMSERMQRVPTGALVLTLGVPLAALFSEIWTLSEVGTSWRQ